MNLLSLRAADLMTRDPEAIGRDATLEDAAVLMHSGGFHCLLVVSDEPGRGIGIITCKDVVALLGEMDAAALSGIRVDEAMTLPAVTVPADLCIRDCINLMQMAGVRTVPVVEHARAVGILTFTDILAHIAT